MYSTRVFIYYFKTQLSGSLYKYWEENNMHLQEKQILSFLHLSNRLRQKIFSKYWNLFKQKYNKQQDKKGYILLGRHLI